MTDEEALLHIKTNSRLNRVRKIFSAEAARLEQAGQQRRPPTAIEFRKIEFEAARKIAAELGVKL